MGLTIEDKGLDIISRYCSNGREVVNLVQLCSGLAITEERNNITEEDIEWVIENGEYSPRVEKKINKEPQVGVVNGLAVYGANMGALMEIEATARRVLNRRGNLKVSGIIEEEEISSSNKKIKRKGTAYCSIQNVLTVLDNLLDVNTEEYDIHVNFPGGIPVDGPSAGISIVTAIYSAITNIPISNKVAMTGEISIQGLVKPIGGVNAKIAAAKKAGANLVIIPQENWSDSFTSLEGIRIKAVNSIEEVIKLSLIEMPEKQGDGHAVEQSMEVLSAQSMGN